MAGQEFKSKGKEVLQMKKDGAVRKNLAEDTEKRVSKRDEDNDFRSEESAGGLPLATFPKLHIPKQNLNDFKNKNIIKQRKHDILEEKHEAKLDKATHKSTALRQELIADKKAVYAERSDIIKSEYGSVSEYNKVNTAIQSDKYRTELISEKKSLLKERSEIIKSEYGSIEKFNKVRKKNGFAKSERLKGLDDKLTDVDKKFKFETEKLDKFYEARGIDELKATTTRKDFTEHRKNALKKSQRLNAAEEKYSDLGGQVNSETAKIKSFSAEKGEIIAERGSLKSVRNTDKLKVDSYRGKLKFAESEGGKFEIKAAKADYRLAKARYKLPQQKIVRKTYAFDEKSGKVKSKLKIEKEVKPINGRSGIVTKGIKSGTKVITNAAVVGIHRQISKYEEDNSALKALHGAEKTAEGAGRFGVRTVKTVNKNIREAPYKKASKLKFQSEKANAKLQFSKSVNANKEVVKSTDVAKKAMQKSVMKKNARKLQKTSSNSVKEVFAKAAKKIQEILIKNKYVVIGIIVVLLLIVIISSIAGTVMMMFSESSGSVIASTYMSDDTDMQNAEDYMKSLENSLQNKIENIQSEYPGYDEYRINADSIGHDPYALISYLSAMHVAFQYDTQLQSDITALYNALYYLEIKSITEVRSRQETRYDENGNPYQVTVYYNYYILEVNLTANDFDTAVQGLLNADQYDLYLLLVETQGNRPDLFQ